MGNADVTLLAVTHDPEALIAKAARVSRRGDNKVTGIEEDRELIRRLIRWGHDSVLEHASATFIIESISRACLAQLTRHRLASFTVESQRYVNMQDADFIIPPSIKNHEDTEAAVKWIKDLDDLVEKYIKMVGYYDIPFEDARYFLPECTATRLIMTANFREWRHIIKLRTSKGAQWEISDLMNEILDILLALAPSVFEDLVAEDKRPVHVA